MEAPHSHLVTVHELIERYPHDDTKQVELLAGVVYVSPRPRSRHSFVETALCHLIGGPFQFRMGAPGGWWLLLEPLVQWSKYDATAPDLVGWRRERVPDFPEEFPIAIVPDWVAEVLSPSTARRDRTAKMELYARSGVPQLWIIDPLLRTVEAFENASGRWVRLGAWTDGDTAAIAPFDAIALDVGALFPPRREPDGVADESEEAYAP